MNIGRALTGFIILVSLTMTAGAIPAKADQTDKPSQRVLFVCQAYDRFFHKFRNRVLILEQTSTKSLSSYSPLNHVNGSSMIDLNSKDTYMGMTGSTEFRMRFYIATLISEDKTEEEIIRELLKKPGDFRVAKYEFQDPAPMDYIGTGYRDGPTFYFRYEREKDGFHKAFDFHLAKYYERKGFNSNNFRDLDSDALKELEKEDVYFPYSFISTNAHSTTLMEDGSYICRKPFLF